MTLWSLKCAANVSDSEEGVTPVSDNTRRGEALDRALMLNRLVRL